MLLGNLLICHDATCSASLRFCSVERALVREIFGECSVAAIAVVRGISAIKKSKFFLFHLF